MKQFDDIISAIATPIGEGGISVIRVSGKGSIELVDKGFRGSTRLRDAKSHTVHYGSLVDQRGQTVDEVLAAVFRAPHSYTAEDVVELSCHGGVYVTRRILESVIALGARIAEPGEFTKRAFLNGRIDLAQAEAVADLIRARSEQSRKTSLVQLQGSLSTEIKLIIDKMTTLCGLIELELDFVEENIRLTSTTSLRQEILSCISRLESLISTFDYGRLVREGIKVVLVGRPNAGKSSLLNAILDQNRAIVTDIPGTTRDVIEENVVLDGLLFRFVDTAGVRDSDDLVEREGVARTREEIRQADLCLMVIDIAKAEIEPETEFLSYVSSLRGEDHHVDFLVFNKIDIAEERTVEVFFRTEPFDLFRKQSVSALTRAGIQDLLRNIVNVCSHNGLGVTEASTMITNQRHKEGMEVAIRGLSLALKSIEEGQSGEVVAVDLRGALDALGSIVGTVTTDDILDTIFSRFCIGK